MAALERDPKPGGGSGNNACSSGLRCGSERGKLKGAEGELLQASGDGGHRRFFLGETGRTRGPLTIVLHHTSGRYTEIHLLLSRLPSTTVAQELLMKSSPLRTAVTEMMTWRTSAEPVGLKEALRGRHRGRPPHICSSSIFIYKQQFPLTLYHKKAIYKQETRIQNKIKQH